MICYVPSNARGVNLRRPPRTPKIKLCWARWVQPSFDPMWYLSDPPGEPGGREKGATGTRWHHLALLILINFSEVVCWKWQPTTNRMVLRPHIFCKFIFLMFSSCICDWIYCFLVMRISQTSILEVCVHFEWRTSNEMDRFWRTIIGYAFAIMNSSKRNGVFHSLLARALGNCACISTQKCIEIFDSNWHFHWCLHCHQHLHKLITK